MSRGSEVFFPVATQVLKRLEGHPFMGWLGLFAHIDLLRSWTRRDLEVRYQGSFLGNWWAVIQPLSTLALYTFVFSVVLNIRFGTPGHGGFAIYLMAGLLPWLAFSETILRATTVIVGNQNLVKKVVFPLPVLPASLVASGLVNQAIGTVVLLAVVAFLSGLKLSLLWLPVILAVQVAFSLGLAWAIASLGVFVRDINAGIGLFLNFWMYLSPILYPAEMVPEAYRWVFAFNPIAFLVEAYRGAILEGHGPDPLLLLAHGSLAIAVMVLGYAFFAKTQRAFADVL